MQQFLLPTLFKWLGVVAELRTRTDCNQEMITTTSNSTIVGEQNLLCLQTSEKHLVHHSDCNAFNSDYTDYSTCDLLQCVFFYRKIETKPNSLFFSFFLKLCNDTYEYHSF